MNNTIQSITKKISEELKAVSDASRLEAELFVAYVCKLTRTDLYTYPEKLLNLRQIQQLEKCVERRLQKEPISYILGYQAFHHLILHVSKSTLIPRAETEELVDWVLNHFDNSKTLKVADLGTGSGAIALTLASECPLWEIHATDICKKALKIAQKNANQYELNQVNFYQGFWCEALPDQNYDVIISNPPYVAENHPNLLELVCEPRKALVAQNEGLQAIEIIASQAKRYLQKNKGTLIMEHGYDQKEKVRVILEKENYSSIDFYQDLNWLDRWVVAE